MSAIGAIDPATILIILVSMIAAGTDLRWRRIPNWLNFSVLLTGLAFNFYLSGSAGLLSALAGVGLAFLLFGSLYAFKIMGAGDVKLLMAFGALGGANFAWKTAVFSIVLGGLAAFVILLTRGKLLSFARRIWRTGVSLLVKQLEFEPFKADRRLKMPFGVAIACAAIWVKIKPPF